LRIRSFGLERWLPTHPCAYDLAGSVVKCLKLRELVKEIDLDMELMHGPTKGGEELRTGVSALYSNANKDNVLITHGAAEGNFIVLSRLLETGDEVVIGGIPTYLQTPGLAEALGSKVKFFSLKENESYKADINNLNEMVSKKTKMIMIVSPNNPTGARFTANEIHKICEVAKDVNAYVLADEVLRYTEIDGTASPSPAEIYGRGISTGSLSKLGLAGLRTGWIVADEELIEEFWTQKDYTTLAGPILSDYVAVIALQRENMKRITQRARKILKENLKILSNWLAENERFLKCVIPSAGATAFPRYEFEMDSVEFCLELLKEKSVLLSPGDYFMSPKHFRILYGGVDGETLKIGLERISGFLSTLARINR